MVKQTGKAKHELAQVQALLTSCTWEGFDPTSNIVQIVEQIQLMAERKAVRDTLRELARSKGGK